MTKFSSLFLMIKMKKVNWLLNWAQAPSSISEAGRWAQMCIQVYTPLADKMDLYLWKKKGNSEAHPTDSEIQQAGLTKARKTQAHYSNCPGSAYATGAYNLPWGEGWGANLIASLQVACFAGGGAYCSVPTCPSLIHWDFWCLFLCFPSLCCFLFPSEIWRQTPFFS